MSILHTCTVPTVKKFHTKCDGAGAHLKARQITSCMARAGKHARRSYKHCKACAKHAHAPPPRARARLYDFHLVEFSYQPVPVPVKQRVETTG